MENKAELLALAERVEGLSGANFAIEQQIGAEVFGPQPYLFPAFTASLDAAMGLVPSPGFIAALSEIAADGLPGCCICTSTNPLTEHWGLGLQRGERAEVLARCVTAAALRARAEGVA